MDGMTSVLTDGQWAVLAPLIEACRPHRKTQHHDLRRTIEAIIWRCQNGAKWRSLPSEFGPPFRSPDLNACGDGSSACWRIMVDGGADLHPPSAAC